MRARLRRLGVDPEGPAGWRKNTSHLTPAEQSEELEKLRDLFNMVTYGSAVSSSCYLGAVPARRPADLGLRRGPRWGGLFSEGPGFRHIPSLTLASDSSATAAARSSTPVSHPPSHPRRPANPAFKPDLMQGVRLSHLLAPPSAPPFLAQPSRIEAFLGPFSFRCARETRCLAVSAIVIFGT
jgi:hypothetical protein